MPSKSKKQQDFMAAVANNPKFAAETGVPQSVGKDYEEADNMKKQGYNARLDDSMGAKNGKKKQSMKSRRDESEGMEKSMGKRKFAGDKAMKFQRGGPMPAGMANRRAGVNNREMPQQAALDQDMMDTPAPTPATPILATGSRSPRRINDPTPAQQRQAMRQARSAARRGGGGRKAGGKIYKAGGKVRGAGCATQGSRPAKMVTMKGA